MQMAFDRNQREIMRAIRHSGNRHGVQFGVGFGDRADVPYFFYFKYELTTVDLLFDAMKYLWLILYSIFVNQLHAIGFP